MTQTYIFPDALAELDEQALRLAFPHACFPVPFEPPDGAVAVHVDEPPTFDAMTQRIERMPAELVDEQWRGAWQVIELTHEERRALKQALVPNAVTRRQARLALLNAGLLDAVDAAIDGMPQATEEERLLRRRAQIDWQDAMTFDRTDPLVLRLGVALGLDDDALDDLYIHAKTL